MQSIAFARLDEPGCSATSTGLDDFSKHVREAIDTWLKTRPEIRQVVSLMALKWADDLVIAVQAELEVEGSASDPVRTIDPIENNLSRSFQPPDGSTLNRSFANTGAIRFEVDKRRTEEGRRITASHFASKLRALIVSSRLA